MLASDGELDDVVRGVMISLCKMVEDRELEGGCTRGSKTWPMNETSHPTHFSSVEPNWFYSGLTCSVWCRGKTARVISDAVCFCYILQTVLVDWLT
jgi:hypothetical protein